MYKHAWGLKLDDRGPRVYRHAVIAFRMGRDNRRRKRVYRRVWEDTSAKITRARWASIHGSYPDALLILDGEEVEVRGDGALVRDWQATQRGLNRGVDPVYGARYMEREFAASQGRDDVAEMSWAGTRRAVRYRPGIDPYPDTCPGCGRDSHGGPCQRQMCLPKAEDSHD